MVAYFSIDADGKPQGHDTETDLKLSETDKIVAAELARDHGPDSFGGSDFPDEPVPNLDEPIPYTVAEAPPPAQSFCGNCGYMSCDGQWRELASGELIQTGDQFGSSEEPKEDWSEESNSKVWGTSVAAERLRFRNDGLRYRRRCAGQLAKIEPEDPLPHGSERRGVSSQEEQVFTAAATDYKLEVEKYRLSSFGNFVFPNTLPTLPNVCRYCRRPICDCEEQRSQNLLGVGLVPSKWVAMEDNTLLSAPQTTPLEARQAILPLMNNMNDVKIVEIRPLIMDFTKSDWTNGFSEPEREAVVHPPHYGGENDPYECIKVIEARNFNFCLGSVLKYLWRHGKKPGADALEDLRKAEFYLRREIERLEKERP